MQTSGKLKFILQDLAELFGEMSNEGELEQLSGAASQVTKMLIKSSPIPSLLAYAERQMRLDNY